MTSASDSVTAALARFHAVIPAGGVGTRLWPLSRADAPKFLHDLTGSGTTLIRSTYERLVPLAGNNVMVVTGESHHGAVTGQIPELRAGDLVLEPEPKDSAAAIGLAAAILDARDQAAGRTGDTGTIMGSFAADHVIAPVSVFQGAVREAVATAATGKIVTIGIKPTHPSTGFGYIRQGDTYEVAGAPHAHHVVEFVEKPEEAVAQDYVASGDYLWNAGMFVAPVAVILQHLAAAEPELHAGLTEIAAAWGTEHQHQMLTRIWPGLPKTAIDYAVAEPAADAGDVAVIPGYFTWDDVGDFAAIARLNPAAQQEGMTVIGPKARVYSEDASGVVVSDTKRVVALIGVENIVVVDTEDALLVTTTNHAQNVKKAVEALKEKGDSDVL
ncbi:mannose-1-phosphate guanylyltransferase [Nesterenkonia alkaliphila]|uniref:Mannose-1-phosphate guanylyltransferase n=1 Tax=Nesterenkonia alkaliphila TaxID=1463631 RepID=A0A7K1UKV2_9MICC|nr:mannose-1-phosphate guanylyltransferase [Nesterenkonia alkaliphila]MVT26631.1 mannose-1-phosphate guanylyltransferase [Nesterenkonia alkaliphila]GFZ92275.1 mannose-1-phosphate guanyltransferase [Nesterenkonia alkaliphila]